jgi:phage terminase large subunit-like protein
MNKKYDKLTKARRFDIACKLVVDEGWTQGKAAAEVGVSRQQLNLHLKDFRQQREDRIEQAKANAAAGIGALGVNEKRRVPPFEEFERMYFGHLQCPDCGCRHDMPSFHREIVDALESDSRRTLVNIPPYHSKSTLVTVKHTIYDIARDPNHRTIIVSKSGPFAKTFLKAISDILSNPDLYIGAERNLIEDWGPFREEGHSQRWSANQFYVAGRVTAEKDPTVLAIGAGEQIYGRRADTIKFDDIAVVENQSNPDRVQGMLGWIDKEALSRIGKSGRAIWVGTRVMPGDIYSFLGQRTGYKVIRYPCIVDDTLEETLWPEHFPYDQALIHRSEMKPADFQLVYQNVDIPGVGASFTPEMIESSKDTSRVVGQFDPAWRMIAGLDPAGGNKDSGFTAMTVVGVDLETGHRYLVDQVAVKSMKAPQMKEQMLEWSSRYPLSEWRVEVNGVQSQLVQYDRELVKELALRGVRVVPHTTHRNKWDATFGVESMAPLFAAGLMSIPWGNAPSARTFQPLIEELLAFPMGRTTDRVMSLWFTHIASKEVLERPHLPMFDERMRVPKRVRSRRKIVDFSANRVNRVPLHDQRAGHLSRMGQTLARPTVGTLGRANLEEFELEPDTPRPVNINPDVWRTTSGNSGDDGA